MLASSARNRLFYGDNLDVLRSRISDDSVDLCYIDPPFNSKRNYFQIYNNQGSDDVAQAQAFVDTWSWGDEAVEGEGFILPISKLNLPTEDVELLREVFRRLPPIGGAVKVQDGHSPARQSAAKTLKTARERVKKLSGEFADEGFTSWVDECLQTKTDKWSRSRDPLYLHYKEWLRKGGHGQNKGEQAEAKATPLPEQKWGRLMRLRFPDAWKPSKRGILYRVTVKPAA